MTEIPDEEQPDRGVVWSSRLFLRVEHALYIALGLILSVTALIALGSAAVSLWPSLIHASDGQALLGIVDRLLFVLMLAEILHTVRVSIRSGVLTPEPFLIVGLIACIRRVLVITMESSPVVAGRATGPADSGPFFNSMTELGILGGLILILVISIYFIRRSELLPPGRG